MVSLQNRADFASLLLKLLEPVKSCYSADHARACLGTTAAVYDRTAAELEGFARPLWGLVPFWLGGGSAPDFEHIYTGGLAAGCNPAAPEYWGGFQNTDQRFVEMASIAYGILLTPERLWNPLPLNTRRNLALWLDGINHYDCPPCNWMFFGVLVNLALKSVKMPYSEQILQDYLEYIESCYQGNGWYLDGQNGEKDYYVSFAFHYYSLIYCLVMDKEDPQRCAIYQERARLFAKDFIHWFAENGAGLAYGRSLTYRFAQCAFFSMCTACQLEVLPYPVMKGIIVRNLRYWMSQPIFDHAGLLQIGYGYPNLLMSEQYNAPGSPYWALKSFALLALPDDHPFWDMEAAPLPSLPVSAQISCGDMLIQHLNGHVFAYTGGRTLPHHHVHMEEKYSKFLYSSCFAFSVPRSMRSLEEAAPDNMLAFELDGYIYTKGVTRNICIQNQRIDMDWSPVSGIDVHTSICLTDTGHKRIHQIRSSVPCRAFDCGAAIPAEASDHSDASCILFSDTCYITSDPDGSGTCMLIHASPNTSLLYPKTVISCIRHALEPGTHTISSSFTLQPIVNK